MKRKKPTRPKGRIIDEGRAGDCRDEIKLKPFVVQTDEGALLVMAETEEEALARYYSSLGLASVRPWDRNKDGDILPLALRDRAEE